MNNWSDLLGPCTYEGDGAAFGVTTSGNKRVYPLVQFKNGEIVEGLQEVLHYLSEGGDELAQARWLGTPNRLLKNTPWEALHEGNWEQVVEAAKSQVNAWTGR